LCLDTFCIGKLKGVGQVTACDAAGSYAWAKVVPARNAEESAVFPIFYSCGGSRSRKRRPDGTEGRRNARMWCQ